MAIKPVTYQGTFNFKSNLYALEVKSRFIDQAHADGYYLGYGEELHAQIVGNKIIIKTGLLLVQGRMNEVVTDTEVAVNTQYHDMAGYVIARIETFHPSDEDNCKFISSTANSYEAISLQKDDVYSAVSENVNKIYDLPIYKFRVDSTGQIVNLEKIIKPIKDYATINEKAESAVAVVNDANTKSANAVTVANNANTKSAQAIETANTAKTTADTAKTTADTAKTTADTAKTTADNAIATANEANTKSSTAETTANEANAKSNTAEATANNANTKSTEAVNTATTANNKADNAVTTANTAKTTADTAKTTADNAIATANEANTKSNNAVATVAELETHIAERQGTTLKRGGTAILTANVEEFATASAVDGKLDKINDTSGSTKIYTVQNGQQKLMNAALGAYSNTLAQRGANATLKAATPIDNDDLTPKSYVDSIATTKLDKVTTTVADGSWRTYVILSDGTQTTKKISSYQAGSSIVYRTDTGTVRTATPTDNNDATPKQYVDTELSKKVDKEEGKALSSNDFTNAHKTKLDELMSGSGEGGEKLYYHSIYLNYGATSDCKGINFTIYNKSATPITKLKKGLFQDKLILAFGQTQDSSKTVLIIGISGEGRDSFYIHYVKCYNNASYEDQGSFSLRHSYYYGYYDGDSRQPTYTMTDIVHEVTDTL